jgi:hypothetical protein
MLKESQGVLPPRDIAALERRIAETTAECAEYRKPAGG